MSRSVERVRQAAEAAGLAIEVKRMGGSTRTAQEAADQCGCSLAQIVKSLVFRGTESGKLHLFLVSGTDTLDLAKAAAAAGENLARADAQAIREETGFAIGGVAPIGHKIAIQAYADRGLLEHEVVWAAAGAHDAVFAANPRDLIGAANAVQADLKTAGREERS